MFKLKKHSGFTLVEVFVSLLVASILIAGGVRIFAYGIEAFNKSTSKIQMMNEGELAMRQIESAVRSALSIYLVQGPNGNSKEVTLYLPRQRGSIDFFLNTRDNTLRCNDHQVGHNNLNILLLPRKIYRPEHGHDLIYPYRVKSLNFKYGDEDYSGYDITDPSSTQYILKIQIELEDDYGNELTLKSYQSRLN